MSNCETQITGLHSELKSYVDRTGQKMAAIQSQLDAIDTNGKESHAGWSGKSLMTS